MDEKKVTYSRVRSQHNKKKRRLKKSVRRFLLLVLLILGSVLTYTFFLENEVVKVSKVNTHTSKETIVSEKVKSNEEIINTTIKISAAGDFTLGRDENYEYSGSFVDEASKNGLPYFVEGIDQLFLEDDFTSVNLETTLTNSTDKADKTFRFKGDPEYAEILKLGGIDAVNLANNHIFDYMQKGYEDTKLALDTFNIGYFGYEDQFISTIKDVKIAALGYEGWQDTPEIREKIKKDIDGLREKGTQIVIIHFHWGDEKQYIPNVNQETLAKFTIDSGADLILGHHPHVIQGIEEYKGKFIVYSLGNFMFGGNRNPSDKDTFVFQQTFHIKDGILTDKKEINIIPYSISSVSDRNNYQPVKLSGEESSRVMEKILHYSNEINGSEWIVYDQDI
ncbi:poly-gamma-glutamate synthesis protein (capsule biosynthesis protein) [Metabacillus crassostreae]|uniref:CapA family protein n=1 Tax=Metabacillus crassostreae TaxID=929098 RepID=UPI00195655F5|nr:CapA family protein [Metabacillus crassostreae]MBM7602128.1 poly-gamma-glutamate synthesis protein (capsule biosynthesis protein) [Metabacillus crassostreae]